MLKSVYALVGSDVFLQLDKLAEILRGVGPQVQRIDFDGETAQLAEVLDELRTFTMFAAAKVVVVRDAEPFISNFRESLERFLHDGGGGGAGTLILRLGSLPSGQRIYKLIVQVGQVCECKVPSDLAGWAIARGKKAHNVTLIPEAARVLADLIGKDLGRLDSELAKLALAAEKGVIDAKTVSGMVSFQREQEMWNMTNELAAGHTAIAVKRWRQLLQTDASTEYRAVTWLVIWLEKVRKALAMLKTGRSQQDIAGQLKIWPQNQVAAFFTTAEALGEEGASRLIDRLALIDYQSKTGVGDMADNVERFLLSVAAESPAR